MAKEQSCRWDSQNKQVGHLRKDRDFLLTMKPWHNLLGCMCLRTIQRDYMLREGHVIKSIIEYRKALERITRRFESECEIEGVKNE